jgi:hypothetical protein
MNETYTPTNHFVVAPTCPAPHLGVAQVEEVEDAVGVEADGRARERAGVPFL